MTSNGFKNFTNRQAGNLLCFVGGFVDTTGYILLKEIFTASVTGNIIKATLQASCDKFAMTLFVVMFAYGFGSAIARTMWVFLVSLDYDDLFIGLTLFSMELYALFICMMVGFSVSDRISETLDENLWAVVLVGSLMSLSMGIQIGTAAYAFKNIPNTTGMTAAVGASMASAANLSLAYASSKELIFFYLLPHERELIKRITSSDDVRILKESLHKQHIDDAWTELLKNVLPLLFFTVGSIIGVFCANHMAFWALIVPEVLLAFLIFEIYLQTRSMSYSERGRIDKSGYVRVENIYPASSEGGETHPHQCNADDNRRNAASIARVSYQDICVSSSIREVEYQGAYDRSDANILRKSDAGLPYAEGEDAFEHSRVMNESDLSRISHTFEGVMQSPTKLEESKISADRRYSSLAHSFDYDI